MQNQIRLLLKEPSDQTLHYLQSSPHLFDTFSKAITLNFTQIDTANFSGVQDIDVTCENLRTFG